MPLVNLKKILISLQDYHPKYIDLNLNRMHRLLKDLGDPHLDLPPTIHVAGTNGKGSTIAFLKSILENGGLKVHAYTSPHLVSFNERIRINGQLITDDYLSELLLEVERINNKKEITFFEFTTATAFLAFSRVKADLLLLEVGLGGRLDATNVVPNILASIITRISFDHEHFLGDTLSLITQEKCGIIKKKTPVITIHQDKNVTQIIKKTSKALYAPLTIINKKDFILGEKSFSFKFNNNFIESPLPSLQGKHQHENSALALTCLKVVSQTLNTFDLNSSINGIKKVRWPARSQFLDNGKLIRLVHKKQRLIVLDGAHNSLGARALKEALKESSDDWLLIFGYLKTRKPEEFLEELRSISSEVITVKIPEQKESYSSKKLLKIAKMIGFSGYASTSIVDAFNRAEESNLCICICGSLYLAGKILSMNESIPN